MFSGYTYRNLVCVPAAPVSGGTSHALASKHLLLFPFRRLFSPLHSFVSCCCCCCRVRPSHLANLINLFGMTCSRFYDRADKAQLAAAAIERERERERKTIEGKELATHCPTQTGTIGVKMGETHNISSLNRSLLSCTAVERTEIKPEKETAQHHDDVLKSS